MNNQYKIIYVINMLLLNQCKFIEIKRDESIIHYNDLINK